VLREREVATAIEAERHRAGRVVREPIVAGLEDAERFARRERSLRLRGIAAHRRAQRDRHHGGQSFFDSHRHSGCTETATRGIVLARQTLNGLAAQKREARRRAFAHVCGL
jgi:hypothetical protein